VRLRALLDRATVLDVHGDPDVEIRAVTHDARAVVPGSLFCCIPGATADGHDFAAEAVRRGAVALLVEHPVAAAVTQVRVASVRADLGRVAAAFHGDPSASMRVLGVTGTNGKTTTTYLLESIARAGGATTGLMGTVGVRIGDRAEPQARTTPEATDLQALLGRMRDAGVDVVAMEVSSHALAMGRVRGTQFAAACFTNLGIDHLDFHGTVERYFMAKASLFTTEHTATAAIHADDPYGALLADVVRRAGIDVWTFGQARATHDLGVDAVVPGPDGTALELVDRRDGRTASLRVPLVGAFNVENVLAAATCALAAGLGWDDVTAGLQEPVVVPGRVERVDNERGITVVVDYAHTPDALERLLDAMRPLAGAGSRLIVVFGAGGDRDRGKRPQMGAAVAGRADVAIVTNDNPRSEDPASIAAAIEAGMAHGAATVQRELDRRAAIRSAIAQARRGDVVVIAGKGHETGQEIGGRVVPFDDRVEARAALEALECA
jgi:UDP-N-acetylmuramoyl-L-alanyl-D-glutamate--2,6-diaminopimelate ligase